MKTILAIGALSLALAAALPAETIVITNATIHTMGPQGTIKNGTLVIENGKIRAVGAAVPLPADGPPHRRSRQGGDAGPVRLRLPDRPRRGQRRRGHRGRAQPGRSDHRRLQRRGRVQSPFGPDPRQPHRRADPRRRRPLSRQDGHLRPGRRDRSRRSRRTAGGFHRALPRRACSPCSARPAPACPEGRGRPPCSCLREAFQDALDYAANRKSFEQGNRRAYALSRLDLEALIPVVKGELPLVIAVDRASDIESALRLAKDFHLKLILAGAAEGWMVAREIAEAKVPVLLRPLSNLPAELREPRRHAGESRAPLQGRRDHRLHERRRPQQPQHQAGRRQRRRLRPPLGRRPRRHDLRPRQASGGSPITTAPSSPARTPTW